MESFAYPLAVLEISDPASRAYAPLRFALEYWIARQQF